MLLAAGLSRGVDPLLQARNPSDFALDFGVEQQAPAHKPFGWDAYWGAADPHAGPSHSFARQRSALLEQQAAPKPTPAAGAAAPPKEPCEDKAYPPLGGPGRSRWSGASRSTTAARGTCPRRTADDGRTSASRA